MNKIIKGCVIGAVLYGVTEFGFEFGKSHMLGTLAKYDCSPNEAISLLEADKRRKLKFIANVAKIVKES